ncbi:sensor histidine kinase [Undibacterium sp. Ren11W]|uniref:sensor histidine kinase n=1 Tax=Undibacterium sp. Ren11W TaxID=3413045 RepID=UPI003BF34D25
MQIKTQQTFGTLLALLAISIIAAILFNSIRQTHQAKARSDFATDTVAKGISGLGLVAFEYIIARPERAKLQWQQSYGSLTRSLAQDMFEETEELAIMRELRLQLQYLQETFSQLVVLDSHRSGNQQEMELAQEVEKRLITQIMVMTQNSSADASRLARLSEQRIIDAQWRTSWLVALLVLLIGAIILLNYVTSLTQILGPIRQLKQGTDAFSKGDFSVRTAVNVKNELGDLSQAFDQMAARLTQSMVALEHKSALLLETNHELESFSYSVSHDLRSPLRGIDGWGLALLEDYGEQLDTTAHEYVARIRAETQRMGQLIDDLLQLARVTRGEIKHESVDFSQLALSVAEQLKQSYGQRQIEFVIQPCLRVVGDPRLLEIVLLNLFENAWKFTAPRTLARIEFGACREVEPASKQLIDAYFVRDNGVGFDMAHAQRLFGAFQRMHRVSEFPGTGIGLATVQRIVHRHGGKIWAVARLDAGACFFFTLPNKSAIESVQLSL